MSGSREVRLTGDDRIKPVLTTITEAHLDDRQPFFSPDGKRLAFARYVWFRGEPWYEASEIHLVDVDGASQGE